MPANITLLPLLPYSPELNPMENIWHYLRENVTAQVILLEGALTGHG